jgi:vitamin-K-epoxide reductase (warfarin-sensitive)
MRYILAILAVTGAVVSGLALQVHYTVGTAPCSINEKWDCGIVNHSSYAVVAGIPVALIGIIGYLGMVWLALARQRVVLLATSLAGLGYALYLAHIERDVIGMWCLYCVISLGIIAVIPILDVIWMIMEAARRRRNRW